MPSAPEYVVKPLPFKNKLAGISEKTIEIHHDKLYAGYVAKMNEVNAKLVAMRDNAEAIAAANQSFSELRALRMGETFATNGVYLHEFYFNCLGGDGKPAGDLAKAIAKKWGSVEKFIEIFSATGMAVRGWVVLCYDTCASELKIYACDSHNQGGVWGAIPIIVMDVYEHAYFIDYGSDRKKYIADFWKNLNWDAAGKTFAEINKHL
jgi:Fe-Mn family superoxide dismutase